MAGERTEQATQHRREEARKQGDILHSRELSAAAGTLAGAMMLGALGNRMFLAWRGAFAGFLELGSAKNWDSGSLAPTLNSMKGLASSLFEPVALLMSAVTAAALGAGLLQTGGVSFYAGAVGFKAGRINPVTNLKNLFSLRAAARLAKSMIPAAALAVFAVQRVIRQLSLPPFSLTRIERLGADIYSLALAAAWLLFGWSLVDYLVEWQSRESRLKMSREDLREEMKQTGGQSPDPRTDSRIATSDAQAARQGRCIESGRCVDKSNSLRRRIKFRFCHDGSAQTAGQRP